MTIIYILLILLFLIGITGLFLFKKYARKMLSLTISYSGFFFLTLLLALENGRKDDILRILVTILLVFTINLVMCSHLIDNIKNQADLPT